MPNRFKLTSQVLDTLASLSLLETIDSESSNHSSDEEDFRVGPPTTSTPESSDVVDRRHTSTPLKNKNNNIIESQCAIDACQVSKPVDNFKEGAFLGIAKHKDGSSVGQSVFQSIPSVSTRLLNSYRIAVSDRTFTYFVYLYQLR